MSSPVIRSMPEFSDKYKFTQKLGEGGYGYVFLITERASGVKRAAKSVRDIKVRNRTFVPSLDHNIPNEIFLWSPLRHPNIASLFEVYLDTASLTWWLVMEYDPDFVDLFKHVDETGPLPEVDSIAIISQLVEVVQYLALCDVDHRDIKDENILYNPTTRTMKLIDFGSCSPLSAAPYEFFRGTDVYVPPEYFLHGKYHALDAATWAIGCLAYVLLDGDCPFQSRKQIAEFSGIGDLKPEYSTDTTHRLNFIRACLNPDPCRRAKLSELSEHPWLLMDHE